MDSIPLKRCSKCQQEKPTTLEYFSSHKRHADGLNSQCKMCNNTYQRERYRNPPPPPTPLPEGYKRCCRCEEIKPATLEYFHARKAVPSGLASMCKGCTSLYLKQRRQDNLEEERAKDRIKERRRARDRTKTRVYGHRSYVKHREERNTHERERYAANGEVRERKSVQGFIYRQGQTEKIAERSHRHYVQNKPHYKEKDMRRKARKRNVTIGDVDYDRILARDGWWCHICGQEILPEQKLEFDHVLPLERGGPHTEENIKPSHRVCNRRKRYKLMEELTDWDRRGP